jgi:hypothetical protein
LKDYKPMEQSGVLNTGLEVEKQAPSISVEQFNGATRHRAHIIEQGLKKPLEEAA